MRRLRSPFAVAKTRALTLSTRTHFASRTAPYSTGCPYHHRLVSEHTGGPESLATPLRPFEDLPFMEASEIVEMGGFINMLDIFKRMRQKYGNVVRTISPIAGMNAVYVLHPDDIKVVYDNEGEYPISVGSLVWPMMKSYAEHGMSFMGFVHGKEWRKLRSTVQKGLSLHADSISYLPFFNRTIGAALEHLPAYSERTDLFCSKLAVEMAASFIFGRGVGTLDGTASPEDVKFVDQVHKVNDLTNLFLHRDPATVVGQEWQELSDAMGFIIDRTRVHMAQTLRNLPTEGTAPYISRLMARVREGAISEKEGAEVIVGLYHSAVETTSATLQWLLYNLAREPTVQNRIREECEKVLGGRELSPQNIDEIPYLRCVLKESMRVTPTVIGNTRILHKSVVLGGHTIPSHTLFVIAPHAIAMDPTIFPDPERFIPERHLREGRKARSIVNPLHDSRLVHMPFSMGPRMCPGANISATESSGFLVKLTQRYRLTLKSGEPAPTKAAFLTVRPVPLPKYGISPICV